MKKIQTRETEGTLVKVVRFTGDGKNVKNPETETTQVDDSSDEIEMIWPEADYDIEKAIQSIREFHTNTGTAEFEFGDVLRVIKHREQHGNFEKYLMRLDIKPRRARLAMGVARNFPRENRRALAVFGSTKLGHLAFAPDHLRAEFVEKQTLLDLRTDECRL